MIWSLRVRKLILTLLVAATAMMPAAASDKSAWVGSWATSLQVLANANAAPAEDMRNATIRQVVRVSLGGERIRLRISNLFGETPLTIDAATVAISEAHSTARIRPQTLRKLTFGGKPKIIVAPGADVLADAIDLPVENGTDLTLSLHIPDAPAIQTGHNGSRATTWFAHGDQTAADDLVDAKGIVHWFFLAGIDVESNGGRAIVLMGDSITDGYGVKPDTNSRWSDFLRERMQADPAFSNVAVLNAGIGGNSIRHDGVGPKPLARLGREVLDVPGVTHLIFLEGVNDLRSVRKGPMSPEQHQKLVADIIKNLREIVARTRARGIKAIGVTILPFGRSMDDQPTPFDDSDRQAVNAWISAPGNFDAVIDLAKVMADPQRPDRLSAEYDNDGLHPSIAGYRAMADAVALVLLHTE